MKKTTTATTATKTVATTATAPKTATTAKTSTKKTSAKTAPKATADTVSDSKAIADRTNDLAKLVADKKQTVAPITDYTPINHVRTIKPYTANDLNGMTVSQLNTYITDHFSPRVMTRYGLTAPAKNARKADLVQFILDAYDAIRKVTAENKAQSAVAASAKTAPKPVAKTAPTAPTPKQTPKQTPKKVPAKKEPEAVVETITRTSRKEREIAVKFPDTITRTFDGEKRTYTRCKDTYTTFADIKAVFDADEIELVFATHWTPRLLSQFDYNSQFGVTTAPKSFTNNLDVTEMIVCCDRQPKIYTISYDTEAVYAFENSDFEIVDNMRLSNGLEYEIYSRAK